MQGAANRLKIDGKRLGRLSVIEFATTTSYGKTRGVTSENLIRKVKTK